MTVITIIIKDIFKMKIRYCEANCAFVCSNVPIYDSSSSSYS